MPLEDPPGGSARGLRQWRSACRRTSTSVARRLRGARAGSAQLGRPPTHEEFAEATARRPHVGEALGVPEARVSLNQPVGDDEGGSAVSSPTRARTIRASLPEESLRVGSSPVFAELPEAERRTPEACSGRRRSARSKRSVPVGLTRERLAARERRPCEARPHADGSRCRRGRRRGRNEPPAFWSSSGLSSACRRGHGQSGQRFGRPPDGDGVQAGHPGDRGAQPASTPEG
jgi:hypothetical protein